MNQHKSETLFAEALQCIPGGVNSPVRAFGNVGGTPPFIKKAKGAYLYDEDGNKYIDYIASWGPMILGHAYPKVVQAIQRQAEDSSSFGAPTELEIKISQLIKSMVPSIDLIRMVNSGTEACMSAIRLARGVTGRDKIIKFEGCYHGHADSFLIKAGSGVATLHIQKVPGVTAGVSQDTLSCPYNDLSSLKDLVAKHAGQIAAIIVEPVAGNMGCVLPEKGFLQGLRDLCTRDGILLIFDEVMTGFRLAGGGAQEIFGIQADIVTYGKVIGAGMPVGAFAGKKEIMEQITPTGKIYQAGTLSGNPIAMSAGFALLGVLKEHPEIYSELAQKTAHLKEGLENVFTEAGIPHTINHMGSMISIFFREGPVRNFTEVAQADKEKFKKFFHAMLRRGIYLPPSPFECYFLNNALSYQDIEQTIQAAKESLKEC